MAFRALGFGRSSGKNQLTQSSATVPQANPSDLTSVKTPQTVRKVFNVGTVVEAPQGNLINYAAPHAEQLLLHQIGAKSDKPDGKLLAFSSDNDHVVYKQQFVRPHADNFTQFAFLTPNIIVAIVNDVIRTYNYHDWSLIQEVSLPGQPYAFKTTTSFQSVPILNPLPPPQNSSLLSVVPSTPQPLIYIAVAVKRQPIHIFVFFPSPQSLTPLSQSTLSSPHSNPTSPTAKPAIGGQHIRFDQLLPKCTVPLFQTISVFEFFPLDISQIPWLTPISESDQDLSAHYQTQESTLSAQVAPGPGSNDIRGGFRSTSSSHQGNSSTKGGGLSRFGAPVLSPDHYDQDAQYDDNSRPSSFGNMSNVSNYSYQGGQNSFVSQNSSLPSSFQGSLDSFSVMSGSHDIQPNASGSGSGPHGSQPNPGHNGQGSTLHPASHIPGFGGPVGYTPNISYTGSTKSLHSVLVEVYKEKEDERKQISELSSGTATATTTGTGTTSGQVRARPQALNQPAANITPYPNIVMVQVPSPKMLLTTATGELFLVDMNLPSHSVLRELNSHSLSLDNFLHRYPQHGKGDQLFDLIVTDKAFVDHYRVGKKNDKGGKDAKSDKKDAKSTKVVLAEPLLENKYFTSEIVGMAQFPFGLIAVAVGPCIFLYNSSGQQVNIFHHLLSANTNTSTGTGTETDTNHPGPINDPNNFSRGFDQDHNNIHSLTYKNDSPSFGTMSPGSYNSSNNNNSNYLNDPNGLTSVLSFANLDNRTSPLLLSKPAQQPGSTNLLSDPDLFSLTDVSSGVPLRPTSKNPNKERWDYSIHDQFDPMPFCVLPYPMTPKPSPTQTLLFYAHPFIVYATLGAVVIINPFKAHDIGINPAMMGGQQGSNPFQKGSDNSTQRTNADQEQQLMLYQQQHLYSLCKNLKPTQVINFRAAANIITAQTLPPTIYTPLQCLHQLPNIFTAATLLAAAAALSPAALSKSLTNYSPAAPTHPLFLTQANPLSTLIPSLYVYNPTTLRVLAPISLHNQIAQLQKSHHFPEARLLCSLSHPQVFEDHGRDQGTGRQEQLYQMHELILLSAFAEFMEGHYDSAIMLFQSSQVNPEHVLLLFPFLLPKTFKPTVSLPSYVRPLDSGPHTLLALSSLIPFLHYLRQTLLRFLGPAADKNIIHQDIYNMLSPYNSLQQDLGLPPTAVAGSGSHSSFGHHQRQHQHHYHQSSQQQQTAPDNIITPSFFNPHTLFATTTQASSTNFTSITIIEDYHEQAGGPTGDTNPIGSGPMMAQKPPTLDYFAAQPAAGDANTHRDYDEYEEDDDGGDFLGTGMVTLNGDRVGANTNINTNNMNTAPDFLRSSSILNASSSLMSSSSTLGTGRNVLEQKKQLLLRQQQMKNQEEQARQHEKSRLTKQTMLHKVLLPFTAYLTPGLLALVDYALLSAYLFTDAGAVKHFLSEKVHSHAFDTIQFLASHQLHDEVITFCRARHLHHYAIQYLTMMIENDMSGDRSNYLSNLSTLTSDHNSTLLNHHSSLQSAALLPRDNFIDPLSPNPVDQNDPNAIAMSGGNPNATAFNPISTFVLYAHWLFHNSAQALCPATLVAGLSSSGAHIGHFSPSHTHPHPFGNHFNERSSSFHSTGGAPAATIASATTAAAASSTPSQSPLNHGYPSAANLPAHLNHQQLQMMQKDNPLGRGLVFIDIGVLNRIFETLEVIAHRDLTVLARIFIPRDAWSAGVQTFVQLYQATPLTTLPILQGSLGGLNMSELLANPGSPRLTTIPSIQGLVLPHQYDAIYQADEDYANAHLPFSEDSSAKVIATSNIGNRGGQIYSLSQSNSGKRIGGVGGGGGDTHHQNPYSPTIARLIFVKLTEIWSHHLEQLQITASYSNPNAKHGNTSHTTQHNKHGQGNRLLGKTPVLSLSSNPLTPDSQALLELQQRQQAALNERLRELELQNGLYASALPSPNSQPGAQNGQGPSHSLHNVSYSLNKYMLFNFLEHLINGFAHYQIIETDLGTYYAETGLFGFGNRPSGGQQQHQSQSHQRSSAFQNSHQTPAIVGDQVVSLPTTTISLPLNYPSLNHNARQQHHQQQSSHYHHSSSSLRHSQSTAQTIIPITRLDPDFQALEYLHTQFGIFCLSTLYDFFNRCGIDGKDSLQQYLSAPDTVPSVQSNDHNQQQQSRQHHLATPRSKLSPILQLKKSIVTIFTKFSHYLSSRALFDPAAILSLLLTISPSTSGLNSLLPALPDVPSLFLAQVKDKSLTSGVRSENAEALTPTLNQNLYHSIFVFESTELYIRLGDYDIALDIYVQLLEFQRAQDLCRNGIPKKNNKIGAVPGAGNGSRSLPGERRSLAPSSSSNPPQTQFQAMSNAATITTYNIKTVSDIMGGLTKPTTQSKNSNPKSATKQQTQQQQQQQQQPTQQPESQENNSFAVLFQLLLQYATNWAQNELLKRQELEENARLEAQQQREAEAQLEREREEETRRRFEREQREVDLLNHSYDDNRSMASDAPKGLSSNLSKLQSAKIVKGSSITFQSSSVVKIVAGPTASTDAASSFAQLGKAQKKKKMSPPALTAGADGEYPYPDDSFPIAEEYGPDDDSDLDEDNDKKQSDPAQGQLSPYLEAALQLLATNPNVVNLGAAFESLFTTQTTLPATIKQRQLLTKEVLMKMDFNNTSSHLGGGNGGLGLGHDLLVDSDTLSVNSNSSPNGIKMVQHTATSLPISTVYPLFNHLLLSLHEYQRQQLVLRALHKKHLYSIKTVLHHHEMSFFNVDSLKTCGHCYKKIQNSAFVVIPVGVLLQSQLNSALGGDGQSPSPRDTPSPRPMKLDAHSAAFVSARVPTTALIRLRGHMHPGGDVFTSNDGVTTSPFDSLPPPVSLSSLQNPHGNNGGSDSTSLQPNSKQAPKSISKLAKTALHQSSILNDFGPGFGSDDLLDRNNSNPISSFANAGGNMMVYVVNLNNLNRFNSFKVLLHYICFNEMKNLQHNNDLDQNGNQ